ncbi:hypothetical protein BS78_10G011100 [Paspalum vaginatum]|nr:hypothetical protein BS78_10G011100 [Paspalum vaginatum]
MSMATRALAAAASTGRRAAGQYGFSALSSCRRGGGAHHQSFSHSSAAQRADHGGGSAAAEVEAALNRKNVDVVQGDRSATLLPDDVAAALRGVGAGADAHDAWVPDQDTGVFVPADEAAGNGNGNGAQEQHGCAPPSVLDQAVFVREEEMEDVERPAVDMETK